MISPEYVEVGNKRYKINTDFRIAIRCNEIATDTSISDYERALAIIYLLYGDEGLKDKENHNRLLELARNYLSCGQELKNDDEPDMDYVKDYHYIWASFMSDYHGLDLDKENMHWWKFSDLMNGLSSSELGNSCILNRIREIRHLDLSTIKDRKERERLAKLKQQVALKKNKQENHLTKEQEESMERLNKMLGL